MPSPELLSERITALFHKQSSRHAFNSFHYVWDEVLRGTVYENMYMVFVCVEFQNFEVIVIGYFFQYLNKVFDNFWCQYLLSVLHTPNDMVV